MQIESTVAQAVQRAQQAQQAGEADAYADAARVWSEAEAALREHVQHTTRLQIQAIIHKLRDGHPLTAEELALVRLWVVGDAESYTAAETSVQEWKDEMKRLTAALGETAQSVGALDASRILHVKALLHDGVRVLWDLHHYLEQKACVSRFFDATQELDGEERAVLADILVSKLRSPDF